MVTRRLHPRHCTEPITVAAYSPSETGFAGTWDTETETWHVQVEGRRELAVTSDGVNAHTVLTIRVPPTPVGGEVLVHDDTDPGARSLIERVPLQSLITYRGRPSYVLAAREVIRHGQLVYLEITTGDRAPLFGGWLLTDAVLERTGGSTPKGHPLPSTDVALPEAVIRHVASTDVDRSENPETTAEMFLPVGAPTVTSTDRVRLPTGPMAGRYQVVGRPEPTPTRTIVNLRRI